MAPPNGGAFDFQQKALPFGRARANFPLRQFITASMPTLEEESLLLRL